jgi:H+/gluconate symporter-like permease
MSPDILHRVAAIASGGFDTGPHNGAIITLLAVCGLTHRESYPDIFALTLLKVSMVLISLVFVSVLGFA